AEFSFTRSARRRGCNQLHAKSRAAERDPGPGWTPGHNRSAARARVSCEPAGSRPRLHRWRGRRPGLSVKRSLNGHGRNVRKPWTSDGKSDNMVAGRENGQIAWHTLDTPGSAPSI